MYSPSRMCDYYLMKIKNRSHKRSHKLEGIGVGRIRTFPFLPIPFSTPSLMIQWKLDCRSRKQKRKNQHITSSGIERCDWFILSHLLPTPPIQFTLGRKRQSHKQNRSSASDSFGLSFTTSYRSTFLIMTLIACEDKELLDLCTRHSHHQNMARVFPGMITTS